MRLAELQQRMQQALLKGDSDAELLALLADPQEQRERRLTVYRNNICHSLLTVLGAAFPVVQQLVGEECFTATGLRFIAKHPPRYPTLYSFGDEFPEFITHFPPLAEGLPWLADVAQLEWMRNEVLFAPNRQSLTPAQLAEIPADQLPELRFRLLPAVRLLESSWAVYAIWTAHQPDGNPLETVNPSQTENVLIWRQQNGAVNQRKLTSGETALISALTVQCPFSEAAEIAASQDSDFDLGTALATLLCDGVLEPPIMAASTSNTCG